MWFPLLMPQWLVPVCALTTKEPATLAQQDELQPGRASFRDIYRLEGHTVPWPGLGQVALLFKKNIHFH